MESAAAADPALNPLWRKADDGRGVVMRITEAGLDVLGIEADGAAVAAWRQGRRRRRATAAAVTLPAPRAAPTARSGKNREGTKQALLVGMLGRAEGTTVAEIVAATGWQPTRCAAPSPAR